VILVIYAILTEQNIAKLFVAAFIPGILAAARLYDRHRHLCPAQARFGGQPRASALFRTLSQPAAVWPVLIVFVAVVGGIYGGIFTPTEAAAIGAFGTGVIALFNGGLNRSTLISSILTTASATGMIFLIVFGAGVFNAFLALSQLPQNRSLCRQPGFQSLAGDGRRFCCSIWCLAA
jgi:C4-dicarboxylate transporter DctM subunit